MTSIVAKSTNIWGAIYDGDEKLWSLLAGYDLRQVLDTHPEWFSEPDILRRRVLLLVIAAVLEDEPILQ